VYFCPLHRASFVARQSSRQNKAHRRTFFNSPAFNSAQALTRTSTLRKSLPNVNPDVLFDVVTSIEQYPAFLPLTKDPVIEFSSDKEMRASITHDLSYCGGPAERVGYHLLLDRENGRITSKSLPTKNTQAVVYDWTLQRDPNGRGVHVEVDFMIKFDSIAFVPLWDLVSSPAINHATDAFITRAQQLQQLTSKEVPEASQFATRYPKLKQERAPKSEREPQRHVNNRQAQDVTPSDYMHLSVFLRHAGEGLMRAAIPKPPVFDEPWQQPPTAPTEHIERSSSPIAPAGDLECSNSHAPVETARPWFFG
jgi:ribosome-associated toxin RatA of RatAB toxin-antitoxin module